jgi:hypothetical protein
MSSLFARGWLTASLIALWLCAVGFATAAPLPQSTPVEPVNTRELDEIRGVFRNLGLKLADVNTASDGRVALAGEYQDRDEVETAFSAARSVVGMRRVAPTTPANIKYRLKGFEQAALETVERMKRKRETAQPAATPPRPPRTYGMILGIGKFKNLPEENFLKFADKDALDFFNVVTSSAADPSANQYIHLLRQEQANSKAVHDLMRTLVHEARAGDTVLVFAASHGAPNAYGKFDIILYDTVFQTRKTGTDAESAGFAVTQRETALTDDDFQQFVSALLIKDVRPVVVLDTCYSGKTFAAIPGFLPARTRSLTQYNKEVEYSTNPSPEQIAELAQKANLAKTSRIIIVSASENEQSLEAPRVGGGMFTQQYVQSLREARDYADAFDDAKPVVIRRARTFRHSQTPQLLVVPEEAATKM